MLPELHVSLSPSPGAARGKTAQGEQNGNREHFGGRHASARAGTGRKTYRASAPKQFPENSDEGKCREGVFFLKFI